MTRWEPDSRGRLEQAAFELYLERGFENTTVADIAEKAGVTERTFFRHFADKREVLFDATNSLQNLMVGGVTGSPDSASPMAAVAEALDAGAGMLQGRKDRARKRQKLIMANPELQERELMKLATLGANLAGALRDRGVKEPTASMSAEVGMAAFRVAFERWTDGDSGDDFKELIHESLDDLNLLT